MTDDIIIMAIVAGTLFLVMGIAERASRKARKKDRR